MAYYHLVLVYDGRQEVFMLNYVKLCKLVFGMMMAALKHKLFHFILFILGWVGVSQVIGLFNQPIFTEPTEYFTICATATLSDDRPFPLYTIKEYHKNPSDFKLCQTPTKQVSEDGIAYFTLAKMADQSYLLTTYHDALADTVEYHYRIDNGEVTPIKWRHGMMAARLMNYFYGLIISMIGYVVLKRVYQTHRKTPPL